MTDPTVHAVEGDERIRTAEQFVATVPQYEYGCIAAKNLRPFDRVMYLGNELECVRQARRTTFFRVVGGPLEGASIQMKREKAFMWSIARAAVARAEEE